MSVARALMFLPGLVIGLTLHEFAHAWSASLLGDDLARRQGRVSLNPFRHLSLLGTLAIFILPIGWAKPVPVNLYNFAHPKRDYLLTSLAGPLANMVVIVICLGVMQLTRHTYALGTVGAPILMLAHEMLNLTAVINVILGAINLLPIPPLDGSKIWPCLIPGLKPSFKPKTTWAFIILFIILLKTNALSPMIGFAVSGMTELMPTADLMIVEDLVTDANAALAAGEYAEAEALCAEALALDAESLEATECRASARLLQENWSGALADMDRVIAIRRYPDPKDRQWRAVVLEHLGRSDEAASDRAMAEAMRQAASRPADAGER